MAAWMWLAALICGSQSAILAPPWADIRRNPCASHPRGWLMLYWPADGKCYTIYKNFLFIILAVAVISVAAKNKLDKDNDPNNSEVILDVLTSPLKGKPAEKSVDDGNDDDKDNVEERDADLVQRGLEPLLDVVKPITGLLASSNLAKNPLDGGDDDDTDDDDDNDEGNTETEDKPSSGDVNPETRGSLLDVVKPVTGLLGLSKPAKNPVDDGDDDNTDDDDVNDDNNTKTEDKPSSSDVKNEKKGLDSQLNVVKPVTGLLASSNPVENPVDDGDDDDTDDDDENDDDNTETENKPSSTDVKPETRVLDSVLGIVKPVTALLGGLGSRR